MWRLRFQKRDGGYLLTKTGLHSIEAASFYAETILADINNHVLVDEATGELVSANLIADSNEYEIEDYWRSPAVVSSK